MKYYKIINRILDGVILLILILIISASGFQDVRTSGWYQQWLPDLHGSSIRSITFLDSLTGFAVTTPDTYDNGYIIRTTNGGDNWEVVHIYPPPNGNVGFTKIMFANHNTGYASTDYPHLFKTTNGGINWSIISEPPRSMLDMAVINADTILYVTPDGYIAGIYRSTNGGISWTRIWTAGSSGNPDKIYMYDKNMGFSCDGSSLTFYFRKTTNGGVNWINLNDTSFFDIEFADTLIGYKTCNQRVNKTTDGGLTWIYQVKPNFSENSSWDISVVNKDTVWYVGPQHYFSGSVYGIIMKTTDGGLNWGYQIPFTEIPRYKFIDFTDKNHGWAYLASNTGIHTTTGGGDTTIYIGINNNVSITPEGYELGQNYPNPFNQSTVIEFQSLTGGVIELKVFDITGKEITTLVNEYKPSGKYSVRFEATGLAGGIYFYSLFVDGKVIDTKKAILIK